jgi:uracil-DNA glycosylase family 4
MNQGFFDLGDGGVVATKEISTKRRIGCEACQLYKKCNSPKMEVYGNIKSDVLLIGENPSAREDELGILSSPTGSYLKNIIKNTGNILEDFAFVYAIRCHTTKNNPLFIQECRKKLNKTIAEIKPKVIITLGDKALRSLIGQKITGRLTGIKMSEFIGEQIPMHEEGYWVCPTYSTWFIRDKKERDIVYEKLFFKHIRKAVFLIDKELPKQIDTKNVCTIHNVKSAIGVLKSEEYTNGKNPICFDYETTGIKPHRDVHEIKTVAISDGITSFAFPMFDHPVFQKEWKTFLENSNIKKIAHKLDFEDNWSYFKCDAIVKGWYWDTLIGAHCLNNQKKTGLKFLMFIKFGILPYDSGVDQFITKSFEKEEYGSNAKNLIERCDLGDLLYYDALDAFYGHHLYQYQKKKMSDKIKIGFDFFMKSMVSLSHIEGNGMRLNMSNLEKQHRILTRKIERVYEEIMNSKEVKLWQYKDSFNPNSDKQLTTMLYDILGNKKPVKGGLVDAEQLQRIGTEFTLNIINYRRYLKMRDTYIGQFKREQVDDIVRPFFNLHIARSFRSSSDAPNFQNIPKRDKEAKQRIRSLIIPRKGNKLIEYDYKGIEVCISACYHKDENMINYIKNPKNDMHRDTAADIFLMAKSEITKDLRQIGKNGFVFPAFYGSTAYNIAPAIWETISANIEIKEHLRNKGIITFNKFQRHIEKVEEIFWNKRFPGYASWKRRTWKRYQEKECVELKTGFICQPPMDFKKVGNYPIQGSAFHCLLYTLDKLQRDLESGLCARSKIIGQIHDAIVADVHPAEEIQFDKLINKHGTEYIKEHWDWINVPLTLEKEAGTIDGDWTTLEECELY